MKDESMQKRCLYLSVGLLLLVGLGGAGAWLALRFAFVLPSSVIRHPSSLVDDPRLTYSGPYRNVDPRVAYVGDAECARCHEAICTSFATHPMGRSLVPATRLIDQQRYSPDTNNPFTALDRRFWAEPQAGRLRHHQAIADDDRPAVERSQEVVWVLGSGRKGYSYLTERDGYLLQTPISWFTQKQRWDLSPGFTLSAVAGRVVSAACLSCHTNRLREHPEHVDRFTPPIFAGQAIGCERCHGPGELHVQGDLDHTIVNPARLPQPLRQAVCEQCHLEGETRVLRAGRGLFDYRPGLPLNEFWAVIVQGPQSGEDSKAVNHVEQMYQSKCFQRPQGEIQLGCTTCHDPHVPVGEPQREEHYRAACLKCHAPPLPQPLSPEGARGGREKLPGCSEALAQRQRTTPADSCITCHMPRYTTSDIAHTASTDHRIVRRPQQRPVQKHPETVAYVDFYQARFPQGDPQAERNLGLGLVKMMTAGMLPSERYGERALFLLESALGRYPQDAELRESKALVLLLLRRPGEALAEARLALAKRPGNWRLRAKAASVAAAEGQTEQAIDEWRQVVEVNPFVPEYQANLAALLVRTGRLDEAREWCDRLLALDPLNVAGRQLRVGFLLQEGKQAEARAEFAILRRLKPPDLAQREEWFAQQLR
jgi:Flp pilus assembly protein TadD